MIKFKSITDFKLADSFFIGHIHTISKLIEGKNSLIDEGVIDSTHFYKVGMESFKINYILSFSQ